MESFVLLGEGHIFFFTKNLFFKKSSTNPNFSESILKSIHREGLEKVKTGSGLHTLMIPSLINSNDVTLTNPDNDWYVMFSMTNDKKSYPL